jgi:hypothetical protein
LALGLRIAVPMINSEKTRPADARSVAYAHA